MTEPLYELTVNFKDLTDEGVRDLALWVISSPETTHMVYWMSKAEQEDDGETERTGHWTEPETGFYECSACRNTQMDKTDFCPDCGARMEVSGDAD